jgi:site-specific recombinase XerD
MAKKPEYVKYPGVFERVKGSNIWWVEHWPNGKRRMKKVGTHEDAVRQKKLFEADKIHNRTFPEPVKLAPVKFKELCDDATEFKKHKNGDSAKANLATIIKATAEFFERDAASIKTAEWQAWLFEERDERDWTKGTYNQYVTALRMIYRIAIEEHEDKPKLILNPLKKVVRYVLKDEKPRFLEVDEAERFRVVIAERWPQHWAAFQFARNTGFRAFAQFNLEWPNVDMRKKEVTLLPRINSKYTKKWVLPMNPIAYAVLEEMHERSKRYNKVHGTKWVFAEYHDGPEYLAVPAYWFPEIVEAAEVKDFTWHSLRHDFASWLVMNGVDIKAVQELMCHDSLKQTMKYVGLRPAHLREAVEKLHRAGE